MTADEYEMFIDGCIEKSIIFGWFLIYFAGTLLSVSFIAFIMDGLLIETSFMAAIWYILPISFTISLPITLFWFFHRKAGELYHIKRLRDFWMGYGTTVTIKRSDNSDSEIDKWCNENLSHMHQQYAHDRKLFVFASKTDAMAFKLRWTE